MNAGDTWLSNCIWVLGGLVVLFLIIRWMVLRADDRAMSSSGEYRGQTPRAGVVDPNAHWSEQLGQGLKLLQAHRTGRHINENATIRVPRKWQNSTDNFEIWNAVKTIERDHPGWGVHIEWED